MTSARAEKNIERLLPCDLVGDFSLFHYLKDHSNVLQALSRLAEYRVPFRCLLIGKGLSPDHADLTKQITTFGLQESVLFVWCRSDIPAAMNLLDLHVLSSPSEGFPNVLANAMGCSMPCASTDVGDALGLVGDKVACCPARDPQALSDVIIELDWEWQYSPQALQACKVASNQRIAEKFSIGVMVEAYEACWFSCVY